MTLLSTDDDRPGIWDRLGIGPRSRYPWAGGILVGWGSCAVGVLIAIAIIHFAL